MVKVGKLFYLVLFINAVIVWGIHFVTDRDLWIPYAFVCIGGLGIKLYEDSEK